MKNNTRKNNKISARAVIFITALVSLFCVFLSLRFGSAKINLSDFCSALLLRDGFETYSAIIYSVRMPRVIGGIVAGCGLAVSGVMLQTVTGNDLASPNIIGINSGAGFAIALSLLIAPNFTVLSPLFAFCGAVATALLITAIGNKSGNGRTSVILGGIAVTAILNSGISFISLLDTDLLSAYNYFSVGGLNGVTLDGLAFPSAVIAVCVTLSVAVSHKAELLILGDDSASALGVKVIFVRNICIVISALTAASVVSFAGLLGFVGLVVPHISRSLVGVRLKKQVFCSIFVGISVVSLADLVGRVIFAPSELPVGVMMSVIGSPFFLILLLRKGRGRRND